MIRSARTEDADALVTLERDTFGSDAWSAAQVEAELAGATRRVVVAEDDGQVIGYGAISVAGDAADLTRIVVAAANRRSGVASNLLAVLHEAARAAGAARILLEVAESNSDAVAFYRAHGYAEIASRRAYYATGEDALVLEHRLDGILDG
jgi:ribosomal-protein-alanine N-acetyltransferase